MLILKINLKNKKYIYYFKIFQAKKYFKIYPPPHSYRNEHNLKLACVVSMRIHFSKKIFFKIFFYYFHKLI
jgi:hypothetical protein